MTKSIPTKRQVTDLERAADDVGLLQALALTMPNDDYRRDQLLSIANKLIRGAIAPARGRVEAEDLERAAQEVEADMDFWTRNADPQDVLRRCVARIRALAPAQPEGWVSLLRECRDEISNTKYAPLGDGVSQHGEGGDPTYCHRCKLVLRVDAILTQAGEEVRTAPSQEGHAHGPAPLKAVPRDTLPEEPPEVTRTRKLLAEGCPLTWEKRLLDWHDGQIARLQELAEERARLEAALTAARLHAELGTARKAHDSAMDMLALTQTQLTAAVSRVDVLEQTRRERDRLQEKVNALPKRLDDYYKEWAPLMRTNDPKYGASDWQWLAQHLRDIATSSAEPEISDEWQERKRAAIAALATRET